MSLWLDNLGASVRFVETASFGRLRVIEAGEDQPDAIVFLHGIGGHLEAYSRNVVALSDQFHVVAFDFVGHGLSDLQQREYTPEMLADCVAELMDALGLDRAHVSGESLGGWVAGHFAVRHAARIGRLMLNTAAGIPITTEKGRADAMQLAALSAKAAQQAPTMESVRARMLWLVHPENAALVDDELVRTRLHFYARPGQQAVAALLGAMARRHDEFLIPLERIEAQTLLLWTETNPIHDLEAARAALPRLPEGQLYVMRGAACHWPQYEQPDEFNRVARCFFATGRLGEQ